MFSKIILIVSLFVSSVSFSADDGQQAKNPHEAQKEVLSLYFSMFIAGGAATQGFTEGVVVNDGSFEDFYKVIGESATTAVMLASNVAFGEAIVGDFLAAAQSFKITEDAITAAHRAIANICSRRPDPQDPEGPQLSMIVLSPKVAGHLVADASWNYVIDHEAELRAEVDTIIDTAIQLPDASSVNWENALSKFENVNLDGMLPIAKRFYLEKVKNIKDLVRLP